MDSDLFFSMIIAVIVAGSVMLRISSDKQFGSSSWVAQMTDALGITAIAVVLFIGFGVGAAMLYSGVVIVLCLLRLVIQMRLTKKATIPR